MFSLVLFPLLFALSHAAAAIPATDYIVVGSGPAGCALAARLCARLPNRRVTLLERATPLTEEEKLSVRAPRLAIDSWNTRLVEAIPTAPNPGLNGRIEIMLTGNVLGGSSAINGAQWNLPPLAQVARWGFRGLTASHAAKLFARADQRTRPRVPPVNLRHDLADEWISAAQKVGFSVLPRPFMERRKEGVYNNLVTVTKAGKRLDACTAYLTPVMNGKCKNNLELIQGATVTKLLLTDREQGVRKTYMCVRGMCRCRRFGPQLRRRVWGVEYRLARSQSVKRRMRARKEVIVSAGPIGSPKLLQLSGIGPRGELKRAGIPAVHQLPVGKGVRSRTIGSIVSAYTGIPTVSDNDPTQVLAPEERQKFLDGQGGLLGTTIGAVNGRFGRDFLLEMTNTFQLIGDPVNGVGAPFILSGCLNQPKARGKISVTGSDPFASPNLALDYLGANGEAARMAVCMRKMRDLHNNLPASLEAVEVRPGGAVMEINEGVARDNALTGYHVVGGCAVGKVVDGDFKVKGIKGVRVVDSSVIPQMPRQAGPMASVYMLAELAADLIREADRC